MTNSSARSWPPFLLFILTFFVAWLLRATVGFAIDLSIPSGWPRFAYGNTMKWLLWVLPAALYIRLVRGESVGEGFKLSTAAPSRQWGAPLAVAALHFVVVAANSYRKQTGTPAHWAEALFDGGFTRFAAALP